VGIVCVRRKFIFNVNKIMDGGTILKVDGPDLNSRPVEWERFEGREAQNVKYNF